VSRQAFDDLEGSVSVYVRERLASLGASDADLLAPRPGYGLMSLTAGDARACTLGVIWDPTPEPLIGNAHAGIMGNKTLARRRRLVDASEVHVWPTPATS
jgi:hypothetical protein